MKKRVTVTAMMMAVILSWPTGALCQTTVTAGKNVQSIGVTAAAEGAQEAVAEIDEEGQEVTAVEGSTVRVIGNDPEAGKVARLKISKIPGSEVVLTQGIWVYGDGIISGGQTIQLAIGVSPANAHPQATWSIEDCDINGNPKGTQKNASLSEDLKLTGLKMGYVKVTASATDGSGVKGSKIFEVSSNAPGPEPVPAETSSIGGGSASFSPEILTPSLVDADPIITVSGIIQQQTNGFDIGMINNMLPGQYQGTQAKIIGKKAFRLVNYSPYLGNFDFTVKIDNIQVSSGRIFLFLMLYIDKNGYLLHDAVSVSLNGHLLSGVLPVDIATAIKDKDFVGIVIK